MTRNGWRVDETMQVRIARNGDLIIDDDGDETTVTSPHDLIQALLEANEAMGNDMPDLCAQGYVRDEDD